MWDFLVSTPRRDLEFSEIAWGGGVGVRPYRPGDGPVGQAWELSASEPKVARELLMGTLLADIRCIDAHVHLGHLAFDQSPEQALVHYEVAISIGELSLEPGYTGLLPWGHLFNRPFLRALRGFGLCLWRLGRAPEARTVFERILSLNPNDNQGARFLWIDIRDGHPWRADTDGNDLEPADRPASSAGRAGRDALLESARESWIDQCEASLDVRARFGVTKALGYLVGEKLANFMNATDSEPALTGEMAEFVAWIRTNYHREEITEYLSNVRDLGAVGHAVSNEERAPSA